MKYRVCVYAICKNEEKFVDRWYESMKEADQIYVMDTGSTDKTVEKLKEHGVIVKTKIIDPWRFDVARCESLKMVSDSASICVCVDLDEVFLPGWRKELEKIWHDGVTRVHYIYNWKLEKDRPVVSFYYDKIHARKGYKWIYPVHEVLVCDGEEVVVSTDKIILNHYPDKTKSRSSYLKLLELSVKEYPWDNRNKHYLGREYMYYSMWDKCIETLKSYLETATWDLEISASMRYIARSYLNLGKTKEALDWGLKSISAASNIRDGYVEVAIIYYNLGNYLEVIKYLTRALTIKNKELVYINEEFSWNYTIDNMLSASYYYLSLYDISLFYIERALKYDPDNDILNDNYKIILDKVKTND